MFKEKEKITVKIFIPKSLRFQNATKTEFLYGKITFDTILGINVFIITRTADKQSIKNGLNLIGKIICETNQFNFKKQIERDHILFERNSIDNNDSDNKLKLIDIHFSNIDLSQSNGFKVQLIFYEIDKFSQLTITKESSTKPILQLIHLIQYEKNSKLLENTSLTSYQLCFNKFLLTLLNILTFLSNKILNFNESVFLRHFSIWSNSLHYFTFKK